MENPSYSPGLSLADLFLFQQIKKILTGRLKSAEEVIANVPRAHAETPKNKAQWSFG
jgi:hypothetical protein